MAKQISDAGYRILFLILSKSNGVSFNELRRAPYRLNPRTLAHQLKRLRSWELVHGEKRTVLGGTQVRYTLTRQGKELLEHHSVPVADLDRVLFQTLPRVLSSSSTIENQLLGIDLATKPPDEYQMKLSVNLSWDHSTCNVALLWEKRGEQIQLKKRPRILLRDVDGHPPDAKA